MTTTRAELENVLQQCGLSSHETAVYLSLLELGPRPASTIARRTGLKRGHTYNILNTLSEKGLVRESAQESVRHFVAAPPTAAIDAMDEKINGLQGARNLMLSVLPKLQSLAPSRVRPPKVKFLRGLSGVKAAFEDTLRFPDSTIRALGDFGTIAPPEISEHLHHWIWKYSDRRAAHGITFRGIINKSTYSDQAFKKRRTQKRHMKMLQGISLPVEILIYSDRVALVSSMHDMLAVIVEDTPIAETLRNFHDAVWPLLPDYR